MKFYESTVDNETRSVGGPTVSVVGHIYQFSFKTYVLAFAMVRPFRVQCMYELLHYSS